MFAVFITTSNFYQLIVSIPSHTARPWFRACGLRGRVWARPAGRRRRATVHAPTAFIMERTQSPVSSSWDTSDSTEPKPRLQSTITTATTTSEIVADNGRIRGSMQPPTLFYVLSSPRSTVPTDRSDHDVHLLLSFLPTSHYLYDCRPRPRLGYVCRPHPRLYHLPI